MLVVVVVVVVFFGEVLLRVSV